MLDLIYKEAWKTFLVHYTHWVYIPGFHIYTRFPYLILTLLVFFLLQYFFFKILVDFYSYFFLKHYLWLFLLKYHHIVALYALNVSVIKYPPSLSFRNNISCRNFTDTYSWQYKYKVWFLIYSECNFSIIGDHEKNNSYTTLFFVPVFKEFISPCKSLLYSCFLILDTDINLKLSLFGINQFFNAKVGETVYHTIDILFFKVSYWMYLTIFIGFLLRNLFYL